ncbi:MAG: M20 family metallopeptidase [Nitrososphaerota archaeon]
MRFLIDIGKYVLKIAKSLIRINTENPPGREFEAASYLADELVKLGLKTRIDRFEDNRANVVSVVGDSRPSLIFNSHLDTVPAGERERWLHPPFSGEIVNGKLYGRGAVDAKGVIASMMGALKILSEEDWPIHGSLFFTAVADEEVEGKGTKKLLKSGLRADFTIVGEPTSLNLYIAHKGRLVLELDFIGRSTHASMSKKGRNAIIYASNFLNTLHKISVREKISITPTIIHGGVKDNIVPDKCTVTLDVRTIPPIDIDHVIKLLKEIVKKSTVSKKCSIRVVRYIPPAEVSRDSFIVKVVANSIREVVGKKTRLGIFPATCDMSFFVNQANIPTVIFGPGDLERAHTVNEFIEVEEMIKASYVYVDVVKKILGKEKVKST